MKKIVLTIGVFWVGFLLLSCKDKLLEEAQLLNEAGSQYLNARLQNQWKVIYAFQHPKYRKAISLEEFKYFNGYVAIDYREDKHSQHVSGAQTYPSVKEIKKNPVRKHPFVGIALPQIYQIIPSSLTTIAGHKIEKVSIADKETLGKVAIRLNVVHSLPPITRSNTKIKRDILYIDYWEKINGKWVIAVMKPFPNIAHISGTVTKEYPLPKDISLWSNAHFIEFDPEGLNPAPQSKLK